MPATRRLFRREGRNYPNAYVTTPLCCPSRTSILTGRYAHNHGVLTQDPQALDVRTTIPRYLQRAGYLSGIVGKYLNRWGLLPGYVPVSPPYFDLWSTTRSDSGYYGSTFNENGRLRKVKGYSTDYIGRKTIEFLQAFERRDERPWFMYTATIAPHPPGVAKATYRQAPVPAWPGDPAVFEADRSDKPPFIQERTNSYERGAALRARQLRSLMSVDDMVRRIFRELRRTGEDRNTVAFFLSDNGFLWSQHGILNKTVPYLQSIRVPLLVRWPRQVGAGSVDDRIVANVDLAPTFAHVAELERPRRPWTGARSSTGAGHATAC